jgi:replicative DNA helicase
MMATADLTFEKGLPASVDTERLVLGSILLNDAVYLQVAGSLSPEDFSLEKHRRIYGRMRDLYGRGERIDRVTLAEELMKQGQLESVDGLSYLVELDAGLPEITNLDSYVRIVKDKAMLRKLIFSSQRIIDRCLMGEEQPDKILASAEESLLKLGEASANEQLSSPASIVESFPGGANAFLDPSQRVRGLSTGFAKFDEMTGGLHAGELVILAARPSMGKTALALNIAQHVATHPQMQKPVAIFSLEMSSASLLTRLLCAGARVDQHKFRAGYLNEEERRKLHFALAQITESPLFMDDSAGVNLMAKDLEVPFLVLSQLRRASEQRPGDHKPMLSDLRDSGSIEQDADLVGFIHREEIYKRDDLSVKGLADLIIAKQRNGPIGTVPLRFLGQYTRFENRIDDLPDEPPE